MKMKAVVLEKPCRAEELQVREVPVPEVKPGWVTVKVKAFGINRGEVITRSQGNPFVKLPRIMGIEFAGEVADPSDSSLRRGQRVISLMGGMGRDFDGSYAEYTQVPADQVYPIESGRDWVELAAIPQTYYTAYASLFDVLRLQPGETLLIRGGTSSVGVAALQLAKSVGATVYATTRHREKAELLKQAGADEVLVDDGNSFEQMVSLAPQGVNKILELVGTETLKESLRLLAEHGVVCMTGILGGQVELDDFLPMRDIPSGRYLTSFASTTIQERILRDLFDHMDRHEIKAPVAQVFSLEEIQKAHLLMESNTANGKIVVVTESQLANL